MTIAKTAARKQYSGDDVTTAFAFPYRFFADSDLQVFLLVVSTGVETLQTLTTHYTVSNNGDETGGTVTMVAEPAAGEKLTILRAIPQTQGTDYATNDPFPAETHEASLDRLTLLVQQLQEESSRALVAPVSDTASLELPLDRASSFLAFDASKNPIASAGTTGSSDIIVSTFMETLLDDTTAVAASQTLDLEKGVDVQVWDAQLDTIAGGSAANATAVTNLTGVNSGDEAVATVTEAGISELATTAEGDTGTDTGRVTPVSTVKSMIDKHVPDLFSATGSAGLFACRAWVNFNGTGTVAIRDSGNVSSITDNGTGDYTVNLTTAMADADYGLIISGNSSLSNDLGRVAMPKNPTTTSFKIRGVQSNDGSTSQDLELAYAAIIG